MKKRTPNATNGTQQPLEAGALPDALLRIQTVAAMVGLSKATIFRWSADGRFPAPVKFGARCTRWPARRVRDYIAAQATCPKVTK